MESSSDPDNVETMDIDKFEAEMIPVLKEGFLLKRKQKGLRTYGVTWQHRYFVVDNVAKMIKYAPRESILEYKHIPFSEIKWAQISRKEEKDGKMGKVIEGGIQFQIQLSASARNGNANRIFSLRASSPIEADEWVNVIQRLSLKTKIQSERSRNASIQNKAETETNPMSDLNEVDISVKSNPDIASKGLNYKSHSHNPKDSTKIHNISRKTTDRGPDILKQILVGVAAEKAKKKFRESIEKETENVEVDKDEEIKESETVSIKKSIRYYFCCCCPCLKATKVSE